MNVTATIIVDGAQHIIETNDRDELEIELSNGSGNSGEVVIFFQPKDTMKTMASVLVMLERIGIKHSVELPEVYDAFPLQLALAAGKLKATRSTRGKRGYNRA